MLYLVGSERFGDRSPINGGRLAHPQSYTSNGCVAQAIP